MSTIFLTPSAWRPAAPGEFVVLELPTFADARGVLTVQDHALPFNPVRTYWIHGANDRVRGGHRHAHTRQALVAVAGEVSIYCNDGHAAQDIRLAQPGHCLIVEPKDWHTMRFTAGAVLLVMSSHGYDRSEYIDPPYPETPPDRVPT